jgi:hypothetical protein
MEQRRRPGARNLPAVDQEIDETQPNQLQEIIMNMFRKVIVAIAAAASLGATINSASAWCNDSYQPSYQPTYDSYSAYDNSDYGYFYNGHDRHDFERGHGRFEFRGHRH